MKKMQMKLAKNCWHSQVRYKSGIEYYLLMKHAWYESAQQDTY